MWIVPSAGKAQVTWLQSFDNPIITDEAATFEFFPAIGVSDLLAQMGLRLHRKSVPVEVAAAIVADVARQIAHSQVTLPTVHPDEILVGFDGRARTVQRPWDAPRPRYAPPVPNVPRPRGASTAPEALSQSYVPPAPGLTCPGSPPPAFDLYPIGPDDDYPEDTIGIFEIDAVFFEDRRASQIDTSFDGVHDAPEEADGRPVTSATASWRLGSMLFHLIDRIPPVGNGSRLARLGALRQGGFTLERLVPDKLRTLLDHALAVDPAERPASASAFMYHLQPLAADPADVSAWLHQEWPWTFAEQRDYTSKRPGPPPPAAAGAVDEPLWLPAGSLEIMRRPVLQSEIESVLGLQTPPLRTDGPAVLVSHDRAQAFASKVNGRLPTVEEWTGAMRVVIGAGGHYGSVWEWTRSRFRDGYRVCGGPWRNLTGVAGVKRARQLSVLDHESWESQASPDVGFRLVRDRS